MKKRHILGMAKSHTNLQQAGQSRSLELDFLRLAYCVMRLRDMGDSAIGYLVVMTAGIAKTLSGWIDKYDTGDSVKILTAPLSAEQVRKLAEEKDRNALGMADGFRGKSVYGRSDASYGRRLGEEALRESIQHQESDAQEVTNRALFPFGIRWDFYSVSEGRVSMMDPESRCPQG